MCYIASNWMERKGTVIYLKAPSRRLSCEALGRGYVGARTDTTQQTNICLDRHLQTRVAPFNQTCLPRLIPIKRGSSLSLLSVGDVQRCMMYGSDDDWDDFLLMDSSNLCLKFMKKRKRFMHQVWGPRTDGGEYTVHNNVLFCFIYK
jgi:hypothetical protein